MIVNMASPTKILDSKDKNNTMEINYLNRIFGLSLVKSWKYVIGINI